MAEIFVKDLSLTYPLLGSGVRKKIINPWASGAGAVARDKDEKSRGVSALKDVSFHLKKGDRLGIVGPNGAGKSTLLRVLAGIYEPSVGEVKVEGEIATLFNIGLGLQAEATGYRNILLSGLISGKTRKEIVAKIPEIEEFSELGEYLKLPVRTYSNGMAMRLKFAAGTTFSPNILLMDEWLGAGDKKFTQKARVRMQEIVSSAGILVLASHRQRLIQNECNKILWLESGEMRAFGEVDDILPEFLDSMEPDGQKSTHILPKSKAAKNSDKIVAPAAASSMPLSSPLPSESPDSKPAEKKKTGGGKSRVKKKAGGKKKAGRKKKAAALTTAKAKGPVKRGKKGGKAEAPIPTKPGRKKRSGGKKKTTTATSSNKTKTASSPPKLKKKRGAGTKKSGNRNKKLK